MKNITKALLSMVLTFSILCSFGNSVFAMNDDVEVLQDDNNVRVARAYVDGEEATATFYKQTGIMEIEENGVKKLVNTKSSKNLYSSSQVESGYTTFSWWHDGEYQEGNSVFTMGYEVYYDEDDDVYRWKLDGDGYIESKTVVETRSNRRKLEDFKENIDKSEEYWTITKGALIGAGASAVVGVVLAIVPEPFASKAAATAALVAAGASAGAALAAGGSYYTSCNYYDKAKDSYDNI